MKHKITLFPQGSERRHITERLVEDDERKPGCRIFVFGPAPQHAGRVPFRRVAHRLRAKRGTRKIKLHVRVGEVLLGPAISSPIVDETEGRSVGKGKGLLVRDRCAYD